MTDMVAGVEFPDPFRWLEEDDARSLGWQAEQDEDARAHLHAWPGRTQLREQLRRNGLQERVYAPVPGGRAWFQRHHEGDVLLEVTEWPGVPGRPLVTSSTVAGDGERLALDWFSPSPAGSLVAIGVSVGGSEISTIRVIDVATGDLLTDAIPFAPLAEVAWLPDSSGFYFNGLAPDMKGVALYGYRLGQPALPAPEPVTVGRYAYAKVSADGRYVTYCSEVGPIFLLDRESADGWQPFCKSWSTPLFSACFVGETLVAVTYEDAPHGRLVAIPVGDCDPAAWVELLPESQLVIRNVAVAGDRLVVGVLDNLRPRLLVLTALGERMGEIPLPQPGPGAIGIVDDGGRLGWEPWVAAARSSDVVAFVFNTFTCGPSVHTHDLAAGTTTCVHEATHLLADTTVELCTATSTDGTSVPFWRVRRSDLDARVERPVLLHAYGGFGAVWFPRFLREFGPVIEAGGELAWAHIRGGGEFGEAWTEAGRGVHKQRSYDDVLSVADHLVREGGTSPTRLAFAGASNGGLMAAVCATQRPDLFAAIVSLVPLSDMGRDTKDAVGKMVMIDFGDPTAPEVAAARRAYSPYHNVRNGVRYPAILIGSVANDFRCPAWHSRKFAARLQDAASPDSGPILLRTWEEGGHRAFHALDAAVDWIGFVMQQLRLVPG